VAKKNAEQLQKKNCFLWQAFAEKHLFGIWNLNRIRGNSKEVFVGRGYLFVGEREGALWQRPPKQ
jgi:hypothetical protein